MNPLEELPWKHTSLQGLAQMVSQTAFPNTTKRMHHDPFVFHMRSELRPVWAELASRIEHDLLKQDVPSQDARTFADTAARYYQGRADKLGDEYVLRHGCVSFSVPAGAFSQIDFGLLGPGFCREARLFYRRGWFDLTEMARLRDDQSPVNDWPRKR